VIRAIIFDFDGLILDTELPDYTAWNEIYHEYGADIPLSVWAGVIGGKMSDNGFDPIRYLQEQSGQTVADVEALQTRRHAREMELIADQSALPGIERLIGEARQSGLKLAIASSSSRRWVTGHLERLGLLAQFDVIKTSDDVAVTKPAPDLFLAALEALGINADEAVVLEDSPNGIAAAKRAGIRAIAVPNTLTRQLDLSQADARFETLADVSLAQLLDGRRSSRVAGLVE